LKEAIEGNQESVELLLNYRKTGEPFWNLLYVGKSTLTSHAFHILAVHGLTRD